MYPEALPFLACPRHPEQGLELISPDPPLADEEILHGTLYCAGCAASYPIIRGIPDLPGPAAWPTSAAQFTNYLPPTAWAYERAWRPHALSLLSGEPFGLERELPLITGMLAQASPGLFVDIACSNGLYARAIAKARHGQAGHVIGVDHAMPMLEQARAFAHSANLRISYIRASAQALPFRTGTASGVAMGGSLNEIGDVAQALREAHRILAPQAPAAFMCLVAAETTPGQAIQGLLGLGGIQFWPLEQLNHAFAEANLQIIQQTRYRIVVFSHLTKA
jgi:ubiquinone/menaquinone biosynthesis C-methylase UbiE/uncharacterized protein YbaR (Trm112 family)